MAVSPETSLFAVQRGDNQLSCLGSELAETLSAGDLLAVHRTDTTYKWEVEEKITINWVNYDVGADLTASTKIIYVEDPNNSNQDVKNERLLIAQAAIKLALEKVAQ